MKAYFFIILSLGLHVYSVVGGGPLLPPPEDEEADDDARGLKGQTNPLASLQKSHAKCTVEGNIGIKNECSKYTECLKKGQIPAPKYCPNGKFFDHKKRICVQSSEAECRNVCPTDGPTFPDPSSPKAFLKCSKGVPSPEICPEGQLYSVTKGACSAGVPAPSEDDDK